MKFSTFIYILTCSIFNCVAEDAILSRDVETELPGIYGSESKSKYIIETTSNDPKTLLNMTKSIPVTILDARAKEREEGLSKRDFFNKYGFVILDHNSSMSVKDWSASNREVAISELIKENYYNGGNKYQTLMDEYRNANTPAKHIYAKEVEGLIRSMFPKAKEVMAPAQGVQRKASDPTSNAKPLKFVHTDYGFSLDELLSNIKFVDFHPHYSKYEETGANELMLVNFWRPTLPMSQPLRSNPLCFLDSSTLRTEDQVVVDYVKDNKSVDGTTLYNLKENPKHKFYFYPDMTTDEVVMFKQFHQVRNESTVRMPTFHTAFSDPVANKETEGRVSFEYRVAIFF